MEKKLLLLGMLESEGGFCPYLMSNELEGTSRIGLGITKANAHRLMSEMSKLGWVQAKKEPGGTTFHITEEGSKAFHNLQRKRLASYVPPEVPSAIALNYLHLMDESDVKSGLLARHEELRARLEVIGAVPVELRNQKKGVELLYRQHQTELVFIEELLSHAG